MKTITKKNFTLARNFCENFLYGSEACMGASGLFEFPNGVKCHTLVGCSIEVCPKLKSNNKTNKT